jgi:hypothetical protein
MQHKTKCKEHFLPIRVFLNRLNNDIVESNSVVVFKNKLQKYPLEIHSHNYNAYRRLITVLIGGLAATRTEQTVKYICWKSYTKAC